METITGAVYPEQPFNEVWTLGKKQKTFLDLSIFGLCESWILYKALLCDAKTTVFAAKRDCSAFLASMDAQDYVRMRTKQIDNLFWGEKKKPAADGPGGEELNDEGLPSDWRKVLMSEAWKNIKNNNFSAEGEEWKLFVQKALKEIETDTVDDPPKRYLAETCSKCRYRIFCEGEDVEDVCERCKYRDFALEKGSEKYDQKNQLR